MDAYGNKAMVVRTGCPTDTVSCNNSTREESLANYGGNNFEQTQMYIQDQLCNIDKEYAEGQAQRRKITCEMLSEFSIGRTGQGAEDIRADTYTARKAVANGAIQSKLASWKLIHMKTADIAAAQSLDEVEEQSNLFQRTVRAAMDEQDFVRKDRDEALSWIQQDSADASSDLYSKCNNTCDTAVRKYKTGMVTLTENSISEIDLFKQNHRAKMTLMTETVDTWCTTRERMLVTKEATEMQQQSQNRRLRTEAAEKHALDLNQRRSSFDADIFERIEERKCEDTIRDVQNEADLKANRLRNEKALNDVKFEASKKTIFADMERDRRSADVDESNRAISSTQRAKQEALNEAMKNYNAELERVTKLAGGRKYKITTAKPKIVDKADGTWYVDANMDVGYTFY